MHNTDTDTNYDQVVTCMLESFGHNSNTNTKIQVPEDKLLPDVMSSNRMRKILEDKNKSIAGQITRITRRFDDVTSSKISRYLDHKIKLDGRGTYSVRARHFTIITHTPHNHSGANPRTYIDKARQTLKELEKSTKPSDTLMLGEMKCISKGLFGDKTERRKVSIKGNSLLCFHLIHDSERREPRETYVVFERTCRSMA